MSETDGFIRASSGRRGGGPGRGRGRGRGWRGGDAGNNSGRGRGAGGSGRGRGGRGNAPQRGENTSGGNKGRGWGRGARRLSDRGHQGPSTTPASGPRNKKVDPSKQLQNGEKGAEAHTVSEADRIRFTKFLMQLREGEETRVELPATLTNTERKFVHQLASQLGLVSKSTGKGDNRRIAVTKRVKQAKKATASEDGMPVLQIGKQGIQALKRHINNFPPTRSEELESRETGASLMEAYGAAISDGDHGNDEESDARIAFTLKQIGLGQQERVTMKQITPKFVNLDHRRARHAAFQTAKKKSPQYSRMMQHRKKLPAFGRQEEVIATVASHPVTIIQGETGCGKSTQCPQFLLDANPEANIVVTQPRRISAISIADRVAQEQCLESGSLVGYQVRLEGAASKDTQLLFVTPGILLRKLQSSPTLSEFSTIVIDEVHERDKYTDFLLIMLRDLLPQRPDLRLVLMSATLQTELLIDYFASCDNKFYQQHPPAVLEIEGRTFPVQEFFLEQILEMTGYIDPTVAAAAAGGRGGENNAMSMEELDAELAKLVGGANPTMAENDSTTAAPVQCLMCGQSFPDHLALGTHVAVCKGTTLAEDEFLDDEAGNLSGDQSPTLAVPPTQLLTPGQMPTNGSEELQEFDDYDVDEPAQIDGYEIQAPLEQKPAASISTEKQIDDNKKWDGIGMFLKPENEQVEATIDVTPEQEALLNHYQTMHDDEKVDTDLLLDVLHYIHKSSHGDGAILIFLPGWQEISEFSLLLESTPPFHDNARFLVLPLHSGIPSADQRRVLQHPPSGKRKIVLSTNIAETSLTIDDVVFVVDAGRSKEKDYDPHLKTSTLQPTWISQASSKQRKGRAGRTKAGVCFHMFSSRRYQSMRPFLESELLRTPLEEMCLFTKKLGLAPGGPEDIDGVPAFLAKAMSPPHEKSISNALELLVDLGAMLPETNDLTNLGQCLSILSLEPRVGKMVIWSYLLGCARVTSQMAVAMSYKSPFALPPTTLRRHAEGAQVELSQGSESDQVTVYNSMIKHDQVKGKSEGAWKDFCRRNFLSPSTMQMISELRKNISRELQSLNFPDPMQTDTFHNRNHNKEALWQAALAAGLYPNVCTRQRGEVNFSTMTNRKCKIHVSSVNAVKGQPLNGKSQIPTGEVEFVCFGEMVKGAHMFTISQTTHLSSPLPLLLLCGSSLTVYPDPDNQQFAVLGLDGWIFFKCQADLAAGLVMLRKRLNEAFLKALAQPKFQGEKTLDAMGRDAVDVLGQVLLSALKSTSVR